MPHSTAAIGAARTQFSQFPDDPLLGIVTALEARGSRFHSGKFQCPAHDDHEPSLSVKLGQDGVVLVHCHAGCATADVLDLLDLTWQDLYPIDRRRYKKAPPRPDVAEMEAAFARGELLPERVVLGRMPQDATSDMKAVAHDMQFLFGLAYARGYRKPMPYACRWGADRQGWTSTTGKNRMSWTLRQLTESRVIRRHQDLKAINGRARGTALYGPPLAVA